MKLFDKFFRRKYEILDGHLYEIAPKRIGALTYVLPGPATEAVAMGLSLAEGEIVRIKGDIFAGKTNGKLFFRKIDHNASPPSFSC